MSLSSFQFALFSFEHIVNLQYEVMGERRGVVVEEAKKTEKTEEDLAIVQGKAMQRHNCNR